MKKQLLKWNLAAALCLAIAGVFTSCTPMDTFIFPPFITPVYPTEEDITEYVELPTYDEVAVHLHAHGYVLYYFSAASVTPNETSLVDNIIKRYVSVQLWNISIEPRQGDMFLFLATEFDAIASNPQFLSAFKKMHASGVILAMEGGVESDFAKVCKALDCYNPYDGMTDATHLPGEKPLWIFSGPLPSAAGIFMKLCPSDESTASNSAVKTGFFNDYTQGHFCDMAVGAIKKSMTPRVATNETNQLTSLVDAYKLIFLKTQTVAKEEYYNYKVKEDRTSEYQVEFDIYNAFSEKEKRNYYYIHVEITCPFANFYIGNFYSDAKGMFKSNGMYGRSITITTNHWSDNDDVVIHRTSPGTTERITNYVSEVSFKVDGEISLSHGPSIEGGIRIDSREEYAVADVLITNNTQPNPAVAEWTFELKEATPYYDAFYYAMCGITPGSLAGRTTFNGGADFIVSMPDKHSPFWAVNYQVDLNLIFCNAGVTQGTNVFTETYFNKITLPVVVKN